jgi:hypothetical protein
MDTARWKREEEEEDQSVFPGPFHDSCTACIVGVAKATSTTTSDSTVEHPVDSSWAPSDAHVIETRECYTSKSIVQKRRSDEWPVRRLNLDL